MEKEYCPLCNKEMEYLINKTRTVKYKRSRGYLEVTLDGICYHWCDACKEGLYTKEDLDLHEVKLKEFHDRRKREKKLLTAGEIKQIRENTGLSQGELERLLGIGEKSFVRWEKNKVDQSKSIDWLLRVIQKYGIGILKEIDQPPFVQINEIEGSSKKEELVKV